MAAQEKLIVEAENRIGASVGDWVMIEGAASKVATAIVLVYVLPLLLFFLGYFFARGYQAMERWPVFWASCWGS
jgi:positive regulator of sigma E activity